VISSYCNCMWILCVVCFRCLDNLSLTYELYELVLLDHQLISNTLASPDDERSVLLKRRILYLTHSDGENSSKSY
jgi:hypothetical protein